MSIGERDERNWSGKRKEEPSARFSRLEGEQRELGSTPMRADIGWYLVKRGGQEPSSFTTVTVGRGLRPQERTQRRHDFVLVFPARPSTTCHYYVFSVRVISLGAAGIYRVSTRKSPPISTLPFPPPPLSSFFSLLFLAVMTLAHPGSAEFSQLVSFH